MASAAANASLLTGRGSSAGGSLRFVGWALLALGCAGAAESREPYPPSAPPAPSPARSAPKKGFHPGQTIFMSSIPIAVTERALGLVTNSESDADFARLLRVRIQVTNAYKTLGELSRRTSVPLVNGVFQLSDLSRLGSRDAPTKGDQKSSFVIDYDEARFAAAAAELARSGGSPSPSAIAAFADEYIDEKTFEHSFDVASRVAVTHAGDCTEHAVFTTALLRRFGFKARVVLGIVLVGVTAKNEKPALLAFGHAWVERYEAKRWYIVDTALAPPEHRDEAAARGGLPPGTALKLAYLPINVLKDESASYARTLMDDVGVDSVLRVEVDASDQAP